jgi:DNA-binding transcriptional MerR regulator
VPEEPQLRTISRAAEALGVTPSWLRFGERLGVFPPARRAPNGWRFYTEADIEVLRGLGVGQGNRESSERGVRD